MKISLPGLQERVGSTMPGVGITESSIDEMLAQNCCFLCEYSEFKLDDNRYLCGHPLIPFKRVVLDINQCPIKMLNNDR